MLNIEIKARRDPGADDAAIARSIGADPKGRLIQCDTYFRVANGRLKLRVTEGRPAELIAYERPDRPGARESRWSAVPVPDPRALAAALEATAGIRAVVRKTRDLFLWKGIRIHCDEVEGLGRFLEFEAPVGEGRDGEAALREVAWLEERFGIRPEDRIGCSYVDLLEAAGVGIRAGFGAQALGAIDEAVAEIDLDAIAANFALLRGRLAPGTKILAVVKAEAYGHGAVPVGRRLLAEGAAMLGVATAAEAGELRAAGIDSPILILSPLPDRQIPAALAARARISLADPRQAEIIARDAARIRTRPIVHIVIDVGMGREGLAPEDALRGFREARGFPDLDVEGLWAHLPASEDEDAAPTREQIRRFEEAARAFASFLPIRIRHLANSGAVLGVPGSTFDMVRVGIALYGYHPAGGPPEPHGLRPAMRVLAPITFVKRVPAGTPISYGGTWRAPRETSIATVRIGYADGYARLLSNRGWMGIGGRRYPVAGRVTMDQTLLDVGDDPVRPGDVAVVFGPGGPGADELARAVDTIPYEILASVGRRVRRIYGRA